MDQTLATKHLSARDFSARVARVPTRDWPIRTELHHRDDKRQSHGYGHAVRIHGECGVVVMDNLGAHHATGVRERIEACGATVLYQPPYSPDLNPIEHAWSKIKTLSEPSAHVRSGC